MAEDQFRKAVELDPRNAFYRDERAFFFENVGRDDDAEQNLLEALQIVPRDRKFWEERKHLHERLAGFHLGRGRHAEAEKEILKALDLVPAKGFSREKRRLRVMLKEIREKQAETSGADSAL